jgi:hypothetical protein
MATSRAVLFGSIIVALALIASAFMLSRQRYAIVQATEGVLLRLDTVSGETVTCVLDHERDVFSAPCDGVRHR